MLTQEQLETKWDEIQGRLIAEFEELTEYELHQAKGSTDQLIGVVHQRTGASQEEVEEFLADIVDGRSPIRRVKRAASQSAEQVQQLVHDRYASASEVTSDLSQQLGKTVRSRPTESMLIAFGLGFLASAPFFLGRPR